MKICTRMLAAAVLGLVSLVLVAADSEEAVYIQSQMMPYLNVSSDNISGLSLATTAISRKLQDDSDGEDSNDVEGDSGAGEVSSLAPTDANADDDGSNDFDTLVLGFCEMQTIVLTECAMGKCSQCEDQVSSSAADIVAAVEGAVVDCDILEGDVCMAAQEGSVCCSECQDEINLYVKCALDALQSSVCLDVSSMCDELVTAGITGGEESSTSTNMDFRMIPWMMVGMTVFQVAFLY